MTRPIAKKYCEGKVKRTLKRGSKALEIVKRKAYATVDCCRLVQLVGVCRRQFLGCNGWGRACGWISAGLRQFVTYQHQIGEVNEALSKVPWGFRSLGSNMVRLPTSFWTEEQERVSLRGYGQMGVAVKVERFFVCASSGGPHSSQ